MDTSSVFELFWLLSKVTRLKWLPPDSGTIGRSNSLRMVLGAACRREPSIALNISLSLLHSRDASDCKAGRYELRLLQQAERHSAEAAARVAQATAEVEEALVQRLDERSKQLTQDNKRLEGYLRMRSKVSPAPSPAPALGLEPASQRHPSLLASALDIILAACCCVTLRVMTRRDCLRNTSPCRSYSRTQRAYGTG